MTAADLPSPAGPVPAASSASHAAGEFLLQAASRAFTLAVWLVAARVAVLFFRPMDWTAYLLPAAVALSVIATVLTLAVTFLARRRRPDQHTEARTAALASATLLVIAFAWSLLSSHI